MKWIALLIILALIPPATTWLRNNQRELPRVAMLLGLLQFLAGMLHLVIAPISWPFWPGFVKGMELSLVDAIAIVMIFSTPRRHRIAHLRWPVGLYAIIVAASALQTNLPATALFYVWQLLRVMLVITAVAMSCRDPRVPRALLLGMGIGLALQALISVKSHFSGVLQAAGTFGHQNQLGMLTHFVVFPALALLLASRKNAVLWIAPLAGMVVVILTASRATIGLAGAGYMLVLAMSIVRRPSARKTRVAMGAIVALAVAAPMAALTLGNRFDHAAPDTGYDERAAFIKAARAMLDDHPLGVGANNYVIIANTQGYSARAGVAMIQSSLSAHVHNAYILAAAEGGWVGGAGFMVMLFWPLIVALRCAWRFRRDPRGEALVGLAGALIIAALHSMYEWIFVTSSTQYLYAIAVGLIAGIGAQLGYWPAKNIRRKAAAPAPVEPAREPVPETVTAATAG